jgi:transposase
MCYNGIMEKKTRTRRDFEALEKRRLEAASLFKKGVKQAEVARRLKASRQSVARWYKAWEQGGAKALKAAGRAGRKPRIIEAQLTRIEKELLKGPRSHGYSTELWTLPRIAKLIQKITGERYNPGHVWRILKRMGWSCQRPATKAKERNEAAIQSWKKEEWPRIKKKPAV